MSSIPEDIIQIVPAQPGWYAVYRLENLDGTVWPKSSSKFPIALWALCRNGEVIPLEPDSDGWLENPCTAKDFVELVYEPTCNNTNPELEDKTDDSSD